MVAYIEVVTCSPDVAGPQRYLAETMLDVNPYASANPILASPCMNTVFPRLGLAVTLLLIAIVAASIELPGTLRHQYQVGDFGNVPSILFTLYFLSVSLFAVIAEATKRPKFLACMKIAFLPLLLGTIAIVLSVAFDRSIVSWAWIRENPSPVLGWITCPVAWLYFALTATRSVPSTPNRVG